MATQRLSHPNWYASAIVYALDVSHFYDSNGDGIGDFRGLTAKLDYLVELGINCLWLLPVYPSTEQDNGYDVTNYLDIDPQLGNLEDFRVFMKGAKEKGIRVIMDLVIQHTSHKHPWFIAATAHRRTKYRDYYVWTDQVTPQIEEKNSFPTVEDGVWQYEENIRAYYRHHFYSSMPDLNIFNKSVQAEISSIMEYWLSFGIDGFRVDAAKYILRRNGNRSGLQADRYFSRLNKFVASINPEAILIGEADVKPADISRFFGHGNRFNMLYNFLLNGSLFLSLATGQNQAMVKCLAQQENIRKRGTWINFVRNADELNLVHLAPEDQQTVMKAFASDPRSQIYNRGIRRRLPPMLQGNRQQIRLVYSLLFALPGVPMFVYGDEVGMGDDLTLPGRNSVRLPMQWTSDKNAGFSAAASGKLIALASNDSRYGYQHINVDAQHKNSRSLLHFFRELIALRKELPLLTKGECKVIDIGSSHVLALAYTLGGQRLLILHNFSAERQPFELPRQFKHGLAHLYGSDVTARKTIDGYGFAWLRTAERSN